MRTIEWESIKANMPWLLDAIVCVALDLFVSFVELLSNIIRAYCVDCNCEAYHKSIASLTKTKLDHTAVHILQVLQQKQEQRRRRPRILQGSRQGRSILTATSLCGAHACACARARGPFIHRDSGIRSFVLFSFEDVPLLLFIICRHLLSYVTQLYTLEGKFSKKNKSEKRFPFMQILI